MNAATAQPRARWSGVGLDLAAFAVGLGCAWWFDWTTTDLVWSLWLSSLVVGYALIVWMVTSPLRSVIGGMTAGGAAQAPAGAAVTLGIVIIGTLFGLAFFTVHFGGFHFVHSAFLNQFFPVAPDARRAFPSLSLYAEVFRRYWWFLPAAALAEREAFRSSETAADARPDTAVTPDAIKARRSKGRAMMTPYQNVVRLHLLIFFFAFAHFAHLANFAVYAVAYAVYFFPWRILRRADA